MSERGYQSEVDGLRAIAVLPVVLFHAGFGAFAGGYVGVDVFFVISGYLITGIIADDIRQGHFSLVHFYERRVRRIIPALMLVIAATLAAGWLLLLPYQLDALGWSVINATTFTSNIWFWRESGYFAPAAALQPLLHTWSLSVEEQFYLLYPLGLWLLAKLRIPLLPAVAAIFLASLALSEFVLARSQPAAFYLLPTRAWELMLGAMLALLPAAVFRGGRPLRELAAIAGLVLIAVPVFTYSADTPFPGLAALPPCLGTALIIHAGRSGGGAVTGVIGSRPLVGLGLISYSLYLWHWPVLVFCRQYLVTIHLAAPVALSAIAASIILAWFSWAFVERPFRNRKRMGRRTLFGAAAAMAIAMLVAGGLSLGGAPGRVTAGTLRLNDGALDAPPQTGLCLIRGDGRQSCAIGADGAPGFAVWGDSHSAALGGGIDLAARARGQAGILYALDNCPPGIAAEDGDAAVGRARCRERNRFVLDRLVADPAARTVILAASWTGYLDRDPEATLDALEQAVSALRRAGRDVVLLAGLPEPAYDVPWALGASSHLGRAPPAGPGPPAVDPRLIQLAARWGVRLIPLFPAFCAGARCDVQRDGRPLFIDSNHVSQHANRTVVGPWLLRQGLFVSAPGG